MRNTPFTASINYGLYPYQASRDGIQKATYSRGSFGAYVKDGLFMEDLRRVCQEVLHDAAALDVDSVIYTSSNCLSTTLQNIMDTNGHTDIFQALYEWSVMDTGGGRQDNLYSIGVEPSGGSDGNFGPLKAYRLLWVCDKIPGRSEVSSLYDNSVHARTTEARWQRLVSKATKHAEKRNVPVHVTADVWLFATLYEDIQHSCVVSTLLAAGVLIIMMLFCMGGNVKYTGVVVISMAVIVMVSIVAQYFIVNDDVDPNNFVSIYLLSGCAVYIPLQMGMQYHYTVGKIPFENRKPDFQLTLFKVLFRSAKMQCLIIIFSSLPLLFADFAIIAKTGQYGVIVGLVTAVFVGVIYPILMRMAEESRCVPTEKYL